MTEDSRGGTTARTDDSASSGRKSGTEEPTGNTSLGAVAGDDERETRDSIARTGEPQRDALGNADGAS